MRARTVRAGWFFTLYYCHVGRRRGPARDVSQAAAALRNFAAMGILVVVRTGSLVRTSFALCATILGMRGQLSDVSHPVCSVGVSRMVRPDIWARCHAI